MLLSTLAQSHSWHEADLPLQCHGGCIFDLSEPSRIEQAFLLDPAGCIKLIADMEVAILQLR